jgi:hypothetical protein
MSGLPVFAIPNDPNCALMYSTCGVQRLPIFPVQPESESWLWGASGRLEGLLGHLGLFSCLQ